MQQIGFSTGALAFGDFRTGIDLQRIDGVSAIELSALREVELAGLIVAIPELELRQFEYISFHAPSTRETLSDAELVEHLKSVADRRIPIVVHPDIIDDFSPWRDLGDCVLLENMDQRKRVCRTPFEMHKYFQELPDAKFCFDIGHAWQLDPTMALSVEFLVRFRDRLAEVHISEVDWRCKHVPISSATAPAFHRVSRLIPDQVPVIIESVVEADRIEKELSVVKRCLSWDTPLFQSQQAATCGNA